MNSSALRAALCSVLASLLLHAAAPKPTPDEVQLAASIAAAPSPSAAADAKRTLWTPGLASAILSAGTARDGANPDGAETLYRLSQSIATTIGDNITAPIAMSTLGNALMRRVAYTEAIPLIAQALAMQTAPDQIRDAAITAITLTLCYNNTGQIEAAVTASARAVDLAAASGDELLLGRAYSAAGSAETWAGNNRAAIDHLRRALAIAEKLNSASGEAAVLNNLGNAARQAFDYEAAASYYQRSLDLKRQQGPGARLASTLNNLGELALTRERYDEAERWFRQTLDSIHTAQDENVRPGTLVNLGVVAQYRHEYEKALSLFDQGIAEAKKNADIGSLTMANLFEASARLEHDRPAEAQANIDAVRDLAVTAGDRRTTMRITVAQGNIYESEGKIENARAEYLSAIRDYEDLRLDIAGDESVASNFDDNTRYGYESLIHLEADAKETARAFRYSELSKSRVLLDDLISGRQAMTRLLTPEETTRNQTLLARLSELNVRLRSTQGAANKVIATQIDQLRQEYSQFRTAVYAGHPELALRRADPEAITPERAAAILPNDRAAFVAYSIGESFAYAFVISRSAGKPVVTVHKLNTNVSKLAALVTKWRNQIAARELGFTTLATELYNILLKPVQPDLTGRDTIIVSPDGVLWQLPFEAMQDARGRFAAENWQFFYAPSLTVLDRMRSATSAISARLSVLALGDPTGDLPEAAAEVAAVGKLYPGRARVLSGRAATEAALRSDASAYSVIHIAAHGVYNDARPLYSWLALAPSTTASKSTDDDGNLEAREIMDLRLSARLVVLSGCETARGSGSGIGVAGMSWALFIAGAPATVASLWKVDSRSTAQLMTGFHKGLAQGQTISSALRAAKLDLLRNPAWRHPFYWAGFIGIGAGN